MLSNNSLYFPRRYFFTILTMFTSYLFLGTALERSYMLDYKNRKRIAWFKASILSIMVFLLLQFFDLFSFMMVISIEGVIAGGLITIMIILIHKKALKEGNRRPEYTAYRSKILTILASFLFIIGIIVEIFGIIKHLKLIDKIIG